MKKERKKLKAENSNNVNYLKEPDNNKPEDYLSSIDDLLNKIRKNCMKLTSFRILSLFQENQYKEIKKEKIFYQLVSEYENSPNLYINYNNNYFDTKEKFIRSLNCSLKNCSFKAIKRNEVEYIKLNERKALEFLTGLYYRNMKDDSTNYSEKIKKSSKISNSTYNKRKKSSYIGKKRRRKKIKINKKNKEKVSRHIDLTDNNNENINNKKNNNIINESKDYKGIKNNEKNTLDDSYLQRLPINNNLKSPNFNCSESVKSYDYPMKDSFNNNFNSFKLPSPSKTELLFNSKNEEQIYDLLKKEIEPINNKIFQINNNLLKTQEKLLNIEENLKLMDQSYEEYLKMKNKLKADCKTLNACFKNIELIIKTLTLFENSEFIPNIKELIKKEIGYFKKYLDLGKDIIEKNKIKIFKLNDLDLNFHASKIFVINGVKEIIGNNNDSILIENIKKIIKPELISFFNCIPYINNSNEKNEHNQDYKILYDESSRLKNAFQIYEEKEQHFKKLLIDQEKD